MKYMPIWNRLDFFERKVLTSKEPLVGLRYIIYVEDNFSEPFVCILCTSYLDIPSKKGSFHNMLGHFKSRAHQKKLVELEYPCVFKKIMDFKKEFDSIEEDVLKLICVEIFARDKFKKLTVTNQECYAACRLNVFNKIQNYKPERDSRFLEMLHSYVENYKQAVKRTLKTIEPKSSEISQETVEIKAEPVDFEAKNEEKYAKLCEEEIEKIKSIYRFYRHQPDIHPNYKKEWNLFWCQMQAENKLDKVTEEWLSCWPNRLNELEYFEILKTKILIRENLHMPADEFYSQKLKKLEKKEAEMEKWLENYLKVLGEIKQEKAQEIKEEIIDRQSSNSSLETIPESDTQINMNLIDYSETAREEINDEACSSKMRTPQMSRCPQELITYRQNFVNFMLPETGPAKRKPLIDIDEISSSKMRTPQMSRCPQEIIAYRQNFVNFMLPETGPAKRKPLIDIDEISSSKMCKISYLPKAHLQGPSDSSTTVYPETSEESIVKNSNNSKPTDVKRQKTSETESFNGVEFSEICILFNNLDRLDDEGKEDLYDYLMKLKKEQPDQYKRLINMNLNEERTMDNRFDGDDDDYDFSELVTTIKNEFRNRDEEDVQFVQKSATKESSTVCIDLTMDD